MKERGILFSAPMVRANRAGVKTQTRRTRGLDKINEAPDSWSYEYAGGVDNAWHTFVQIGHNPDALKIRCPYGVPCDRLWVRETWTGSWAYETMHIVYAADGAERDLEIPDVPADYQLPKAALKPLNWVSPLFLPRWASRDTLEVVSARPERLQDITEADALAEGFGPRQSIALFRGTWSVINGLESWNLNPWVWRVEYRRL